MVAYTLGPFSYTVRWWYEIDPVEEAAIYLSKEGDRANLSQDEKEDEVNVQTKEPQ